MSLTAGNTTTNIDEEVSDRILTAPNVISAVRMLLVPVYLWLLLEGRNVAALVVFSVAAATDFVDGQVARRTHQVSKLGKLLDPAVDTLLMVTGVLGLVLVGRIPVWIAALVFAREAYLIIGGAALLKKFDIHVPVIYPGKVATTFLFVGFAGLFLNAPMIPGLGILDVGWLPGFSGEPVAAWIWLVYVGLAMQVGVTVYYSVQAYRKLKAALDARNDSNLREEAPGRNS